ncbi:MAG: tetratricopeptide repeat protein, partial [Myxococcaceae bacterium]
MNQQKLELAFRFHQDGFFDAAGRIYQEILKSDPCHVDALQLSGLIAYQRLDLKNAENFFLKAICVNSLHAAAQLNLGAMLMAAGRVDEALLRYDRVIAIQPNYADAYYNRGVALQELQQFAKCVADYDRAVTINSDFADAFNNRGNALNGLNLFHEALINFQNAMVLAPGSADSYYNASISLQKTDRFDEALIRLDQAIVIKSECANFYNSQGIVFTQMRRFEKALNSLDRAVSINPHFADAYNHRGMVSYQQHSYGEALLDFNKAISLKTDYSDAMYNKGLALQELGRWDEASTSMDKALSIKSDYDGLFGMALYLRLKLNDWSRLNDQLDRIRVDTLAKKNVTTPFIALSIFDDPALQYVAARQHLVNKAPMKSFEKNQFHIKKHPKIRLAYFSADFRTHPMSQLISGVFERHDRHKFELIAFSFGPEAPNEMRTRIRNVSDQFIDVRLLSDEEIRNLAFRMEIDIAIDLMGFTANSRTSVFS